jgi:hypothetical protein
MRIIPPAKHRANQGIIGPHPSTMPPGLISLTGMIANRLMTPESMNIKKSSL